MDLLHYWMSFEVIWHIGKRQLREEPIECMLKMDLIVQLYLRFCSRLVLVSYLHPWHIKVASLFLVFYSKQRSPMFFYLSWRFAFQSGEHPQNSNAFLVYKNKNQTNKKKYRWPGINSYDVITKKYTTFVITTCNITEKLLHLPNVLYNVYYVTCGLPKKKKKITIKNTT